MRKFCPRLYHTRTSQLLFSTTENDPACFTTDGKRKITIAQGDGIGPEIMQATMRILRRAGAKLEFEEIEIGEKVYGHVPSGIEEKGWESLKRTKVFLKSPIKNPIGDGAQSLNVIVRKKLGLFSNTQRVISYSPYVSSLHDNIDLVVIRENEEDLYEGIEYHHTPEVFQSIKLITIPGSTRICRFAFEYAQRNHRKKVTCVSKSNIMKLSDGAFVKVFQEIAKQYPDIISEHKLADAATAQVATKPELFDVIVTLNLYGDIINEVAAGVAGSIGMAGCANIGDTYAMFDTIHGCAPDLTGMDVANPCGLINSAVMMLSHIGQPEVAAKIKNALLRTIEDGIHTADIYRMGNHYSKERVGTFQFAEEVIARLGMKPEKLALQSDSINWPEVSNFENSKIPINLLASDRELIGVDVFVYMDQVKRDSNHLATQINSAICPEFELQSITNRGIKVWPNPHLTTCRVDHWGCRFVRKENSHGKLDPLAITKLLSRLMQGGIEVVQIENLYTLGSIPGYRCPV